MTEQNTLWDTTNNAIQAGYENSRKEWREYALDCVENICREKEEFTMDDIRDLIRNSPPKTHDMRAMGGVMKAAKKMRWCESTGEIRHSNNTSAHGAPTHVWRSLIYQNPKLKPIIL